MNTNTFSTIAAVAMVAWTGPALAQSENVASGATAQAAAAALPPGMKNYHIQPVLLPGQVIKGSIAADVSQFGTYPAGCFQIHTEPGSRWSISLKFEDLYPSITISEDAECENATSAASDSVWRKGIVSFEAGGGTYLVVIRGYGQGKSGTYTLRVESKPGKPTAKAIVRGAPTVIYPAGTASTVGGQSGNKYVAGATIKDCSDCPEMVIVPAGSFMMGSPPNEQGRNANEGPRHLVKFARPFAIGKHEVTEDVWAACKADGACYMPYEGSFPIISGRPIIRDYFDAMQVVAWLTKKTGQKYFLPSEAEWEYATRAGTDTPWNTGDAIITDDANILSKPGFDMRIGSNPPNAFGLFDTHGNFTEWVQDCMSPNGYSGAPADGSAMELPNCKRIYRDGLYTAEPAAVRSAARYATGSNMPAGFRVARALE
jgi:formylglycine-generating enzyme required for sulfatase activity